MAIYPAFERRGLSREHSKGDLSNMRCAPVSAYNDVYVLASAFSFHSLNLVFRYHLKLQEKFTYDV
jgi:hypothetical protein